MVTSGFFNSIAHDRTYDARDFNVLLDGIIRDGVFMSIGTRFEVTSDNVSRNVLVGDGQAWFNTSWIKNKGPLRFTVPASEVILNRIDGIFFQIDPDGRRKNDIIYKKGTPSSAPEPPSYTHKDNAVVKEYPIAFIFVGSGTVNVTQADITNMVGTSETPFVTGILETMNIDMLVAQWGAQWNAFYNKQEQAITDSVNNWLLLIDAQYRELVKKNADVSKYGDEIKESWDTFSEGMKVAFINDYNKQVAEMNKTNKEMKDWFESQTAEYQNQWRTWYNEYVGIMTQSMNQWRTQMEMMFDGYNSQFRAWLDSKEAEFTTWFNSLRVMLDGNVAANLANSILENTNAIKKLTQGLVTEHSIFDPVYDNSSDLISDSNGQPIEARIIFVVK